MAKKPNRRLFYTFLVVRIFMAFVSKSYHHGDETYQSVEVAHGLVFGRGHLTWEWTSDSPIRSYLHPLLFAALFQILKILNLDNAANVVIMPKILQGVISAISDVYIMRFYLLNFDRRGKKLFLLAYISNSSLLYFMSRTLVNSLETSLGNIALCFYSLSIKKLQEPSRSVKEMSNKIKVEKNDDKDTKAQDEKCRIAKRDKDNEPPEIYSQEMYVFLVTLSFIVRATTAILWLPLVTYHIYLLHQKGKFCEILLKKLAPISVTMFIISTIIDSICHGAFVCIHWNFFKFNLVVDVSSQCGVQPIYLYIFIGMWTVNFVGLFFFPGLLKALKNISEFRIYIFSGCWTFCIFSLIGHKEVRFLLPIIPLCICVSVYYMQDCVCVLRNQRKLCFLIIFFNLSLLLYETFFVQLGPTVVTSYLSTDIDSIRAKSVNNLDTKSHLSILFMTHCHSTPLYSHIHSDVPIFIAPCPLITQRDWRSVVDRRQKEIWLNDDTTLLTDWPHLYLFKYFRHPINEDEFNKVDSSYKDYILNTWTSIYTPNDATPIKCNLTEKMLQHNSNVDVFGINLPMPSHIITLQGTQHSVYNDFLVQKGYQITKRFDHSSFSIFNENSGLQYHVYKKASF